MNSLERIVAAVRFERPDRVPVVAQVFGHAATLAGVALGDYVRDGATLARCQLAALEYYDYDAVFALMDANVEAEALGCGITYRPQNYPFVHHHVLADGADPDRLSLPDPQRDGRMPELLRAARLLRETLADRMLIVGCVLGPMTLASQLLGIEAALYLAADQPERLGAVLDLATEVAIRFGSAQLEAGVHLPIVFDPTASPEVLPPALYHELLLSRHTRLFAALKQAGSAVNWLHIAGTSTPILPAYVQAGVELANFDFCVDPLAAQRLLPQICLDGNIKPLAFVEAPPALISAEATRLLGLFAERGGFILSSGCEIPPEAQPANISAMVLAARQGE